MEKAASPAAAPEAGGRDGERTAAALPACRRDRWRAGLYIGGTALAIALIVFGELVWLPDPLRFLGGARWIDALDIVVYAIAAVPAMWAAAAFAGLVGERRAERPTGRRLGARVRAVAPAALSAGCSCAAVGALAALRPEPQPLIAAAVLLGAAWLAAFADLAALELRRTRLPRRALAAFAATALLLAALLWPTGSLVLYPGLTVDMSRYARAEGGAEHGRIDGVLVFERPAFAADWLYARLFPHYRFRPIENLGMPLGEYDELVRSMKTSANDAGSAIAFERVGLGKGIVAMGVRITGIQTGSPASGALRAGDVIVEAAGMRVASVAELSIAMEAVAPGAVVPLTVVRSGAEMRLTAPTTMPDDGTERAVFGVLVENVEAPDVPLPVRFRDYLVHEGGPSHGAMLALALIDQLTPGGVTGGLHVAGTGTIGAGGLIGPVGGVEQKAYTVARSGADVFFVPAGQEDEARSGAPGLRIVPVRTIDDVLNWLKSGV